MREEESRLARTPRLRVSRRFLRSVGVGKADAGNARGDAGRARRARSRSTARSDAFRRFRRDCRTYRAVTTRAPMTEDARARTETRAGATRPAIAETTVVFRETRALVGPARTAPAAVEEDMANILPERKEGRREWDGAFASRRVREAGGCWLARIDWLTRQRVQDQYFDSRVENHTHVVSLDNPILSNCLHFMKTT